MQKDGRRLFKFPFYLALGLVLAMAILTGPLVSFTTGSTARAFANCTYTQGYWKNHPWTWPVNVTLGDRTYSPDELLTIYNTSPKGDATYILAHQLLTTKLNMSSGADSTVLGTTIAEADYWLIANPLGSNPSGDAASIGLDYASTLASFNNGMIGPGHCGNDVPTPCLAYNGDPALCHKD